VSEDNKRVEREARLRWVPIEDMRVSPLAQREINQARVDKIAASFDLEQIGTPTVNHRDNHYFVIDGQHRIEALKLIGWGDQKVQCWTYEGLSEQEEAEKFLKLNDTLAVSAIAKFRVGVQAGRETECDINRIVMSHGLRVTLDKGDGAIGAVGTLTRVYNRAGARVLSRTLHIVSEAYGDAGLQAEVIDGIGHLCDRYNGELDDERTIQVLKKVMGGVHGLTGRARQIQLQTGNQKGQCVAAAAVEFINRVRGGNKIASWWREAA
jgi:hypothetical protein